MEYHVTENTFPNYQAVQDNKIFDYKHTIVI